MAIVFTTVNSKSTIPCEFINPRIVEKIKQQKLLSCMYCFAVKGSPKIRKPEDVWPSSTNSSKCLTIISEVIADKHNNEKMKRVKESGASFRKNKNPEKI